MSAPKATATVSKPMVMPTINSSSVAPRWLVRRGNGWGECMDMVVGPRVMGWGNARLQEHLHQGYSAGWG